MRINNVIKKPVVTEKSVGLASTGKYVFSVVRNATKGRIAKEIKNLYNVDVLNVSTIVMPGKKRRILKTRRFAKTSSWKKAIVQLKEGQHIDVFPKEQ
ncbi:50S ribosomal protein L23 [candidate division WWE3 bacterium RBG_13_37_7]|uniref:Large ribosomal subunit protein uL23 n=1 Tax=candidate division WWE3 bacterium RBG_13_37_7 TaxID=1802609 RepID=A0A1F4U0C0_UNCKA|nr:MAG: 50S ribosomal protein L23 [candidate division WWE3 bacterium RBG_13_37_7]